MPRWQQEPDPPVLVVGFASGALGDLVLLEAQVGQPLRLLRQGGFLLCLLAQSSGFSKRWQCPRILSIYFVSVVGEFGRPQLQYSIDGFGTWAP